MSDIKLARSHSLPIAKAKALVQKTADRLAAQYNLSSEWHGNTLRFHRTGVEGQMDVTHSEIRLDLTLGLLLKPLKGQIVDHIEHDLDTALRRDARTQTKKRTGKTKREI